MRLTRASSYALQAVSFMAAQKHNKPIASHLIARGAVAPGNKEIPERFLLKVLKPLVSARVLLSIKGPNGGYRLARAPSDISILEILEAVDDPICGHAPFEVDQGNGPLNRKLETICKQLAEQTRKHLGKILVADLLPGPKRQRASAG
jgi:Rrf2 family protein